MTESVDNTDENRRRAVLWGAAALLLLFPLVAMQFSDEVNWTPADFLVFGTMLVCACGAYELATRASANKTYRIAAGVAVATAFILVWANLAVGIIGAAGNPANLMYAGVLAVGLIGASIARLQPRGMARALLATAIAQALVDVIAVVSGLGHTFMVTGFFVALWLASAWLFAKAGQPDPATGN
jgi:hypothetical protein